METNWIDVCKAGTFTAKSGNEVTLSRDEIDAIAAGYNPADREAPLVFGHPDTDSPAFGWASAWRTVTELRDGQMEHILQGRFKQVPASVKDLVGNGYYKKVSLALMPDKKTVRHVGLLGATQPAVPGLKSVSMEASGDDAIVIEFANTAGPSAPHKKEKNMPKTVEQLEMELAAEKDRTKALQADNDKLRTDLSAANTKADTAETSLASFKTDQRNKTIETRLDKVIADDRLKPADRSAKLAIAMSLANDTEEIELSAGAGKKTKLDIFFEDLEKGTKLGLSGSEFSAPGDDKDKGGAFEDLTQHV